MIVWVVVRAAPGRLLALCPSYRRQGRAARRPGTVGAGAKPGRLDPTVAVVVPCWTGQVRLPEVADIDAVVGKTGRRLLR